MNTKPLWPAGGFKPGTETKSVGEVGPEPVHGPFSQTDNGSVRPIITHHDEHPGEVTLIPGVNCE